VVFLNWDDAHAFCAWLTQKEGKKYRLPTEAEWEYACRAGTQTKYSFGDDGNDLLDHAWFALNSNSQTHAAGQKIPNAWGLSDVHGNAWQWCEDWFNAEYYAHSPTDDPTGPTTGPDRVLRGGAWDDTAEYCRSAFRHIWADGGERYRRSGFRVVQDSADK
jgi:formylglycine-generating enzyme required for sulfatase activity